MLAIVSVDHFLGAYCTALAKALWLQVLQVLAQLQNSEKEWEMIIDYDVVSQCCKSMAEFQWFLGKNVI